MARLKVFRATLGFFDTVVAAPSQTAALAAWGTRQNLFHEGIAAATDDPAAVEAALARPGEVLRRGAGTADPFRPASEPAVSLPQPPPAQPKRAQPKRAQPAAPQAALPPPPDRTALDAAEAALAAREHAFAEALDALEDRRRALALEEARLREAMARDREALDATLDAARQAYVAAGGELNVRPASARPGPRRARR